MKTTPSPTLVNARTSADVTEVPYRIAKVFPAARQAAAIVGVATATVSTPAEPGGMGRATSVMVPVKLDGPDPGDGAGHVAHRAADPTKRRNDGEDALTRGRRGIGPVHVIVTRELKRLQAWR